MKRKSKVRNSAAGRGAAKRAAKKATEIIMNLQVISQMRLGTMGISLNSQLIIK